MGFEKSTNDEIVDIKLKIENNTIEKIYVDIISKIDNNFK